MTTCPLVVNHTESVFVIGLTSVILTSLLTSVNKQNVGIYWLSRSLVSRRLLKIRSAELAELLKLFRRKSSRAPSSSFSSSNNSATVFTAFVCYVLAGEEETSGPR